jgi:hypothetical protein
VRSIASVGKRQNACFLLRTVADVFAACREKDANWRKCQ